jgi:hypothetical protein
MRSVASRLGPLGAVVLAALGAGCGGDAFETGGADADGAGGQGNPGPGVGPRPSAEDDVEPRLDVDPSTALGELQAAERVTLCGDILRVFNTDVDNDRYRELHCTDLAYRASGGDDPECTNRHDACQEQLPRPVMSDRVQDSLGCDAGRQRFVTPAGQVTLDSACATVEQVLDCWRAFGVAYERAFFAAVSGSPTSCAQAQSNPPVLSAQVEFGIPRACDDLVAAASRCP